MRWQFRISLAKKNISTAGANKPYFHFELSLFMCAPQLFMAVLNPCFDDYDKFPIMNEKLYDLYAKRLPSCVLSVCRFCVRKRRKMSSISAVLSNESRLSKLFYQVTQLQLNTTAEYPDLICTNCEVTLQETAKHITAFQEADIFWRAYFQRQEQKEQQNIIFKTGNFDECSKSSSYEEPSIAVQEYPIEEIQLGDIKVETPDLDALQPTDAAVGTLPIG